MLPAGIGEEIQTAINSAMDNAYKYGRNYTVGAVSIPDAFVLCWVFHMKISNEMKWDQLQKKVNSIKVKTSVISKSFVLRVVMYRPPFELLPFWSN